MQNFWNERWKLFSVVEVEIQLFSLPEKQGRLDKWVEFGVVEWKSAKLTSFMKVFLLSVFLVKSRNFFSLGNFFPIKPTNEILFAFSWGNGTFLQNLSYLDLLFSTPNWNSCWAETWSLHSDLGSSASPAQLGSPRSKFFTPHKCLISASCIWWIVAISQQS